MSYNFLPYDQDQLQLMPPSLHDWVAEDSLVRFMSDLVEEFDARGRLSGFYAKRREDGWGRASYHPRMMVKITLYGYIVGTRSSRKIARALEENVAFRYLSGNQRPDHRTISDFRTANLTEWQALFVEVLELCRQAKLVKMGIVAMDGRKIAANASIDRNRSQKKLQKLAAEILKEAEETDAREDQQYGVENRGDELPPEARTREGRKKMIDRALAEIDRMKKKAAEDQAERVREWDDAKARGEKRMGPRPSLTPRKRKRDQIEKFQPNLTDPDSRVLKTRRGWLQGYNGQIVVDCDSQVIVAHALTNEADDSVHLQMLLNRCEEQAGERPAVGLADAGFWSAANARLSDEGTELLIAVEAASRFRKNATGESHAKRRKTKGRPTGPEAEAMREKLAAKRDTYKLRSKTVEPVFGQMCMRGLNEFLLRGLPKAAGEWSLFAISHNILKLFRSGWSPKRPLIAG